MLNPWWNMWFKRRMMYKWSRRILNQENYYLISINFIIKTRKKINTSTKLFKTSSSEWKNHKVKILSMACGIWLRWFSQMLYKKSKLIVWSKSTLKPSLIQSCLWILFVCWMKMEKMNELNVQIKNGQNILIF